jgi:hypothetical protein
VELLAVLNGGDLEKIGGLKDIGAKRVNPPDLKRGVYIA